MSTRLTALAIEKIRPGTSRREIADAGCPGLYLVVQTSGAKSWAVPCRIVGKPTKVTLGPYPRIELTAAREQARKAMTWIAGSIRGSGGRKSTRSTRGAEQTPCAPSPRSSATST
jgi:Arm DNA-binding domain